MRVEIGATRTSSIGGNRLREGTMQYALLIYETAERFANRTLDKADAYIASLRAYHRMLVEAGVYVSPPPLPGTSPATVARAALSPAPLPAPPCRDATP